MKPVVMITLAATLLGLAGLAAFLYSTGRDPMLFFVALSAIIPTLGALFLGQKTVQQTNGNLSIERQQRIAAQAENAQLRSLLTPEQAASVPVPQIVTVPIPDQKVSGQ